MWCTCGGQDGSGARATMDVPSVAQYMFKENTNVSASRLQVQDTLLKSFLQHREGRSNPLNAAHRATSIEHTVFSSFDPQGGQKHQYGDKIRSLRSAVQANDDLARRVLRGDITAAQLVSMTREELNSEETKCHTAETRKQAAEEANPDMSEFVSKVRQNFGLQAEGGSFQCRRCQGVKTSHHAQQTRSSDEPMTMFIHCETCGHRWKEH